MGVKTIDACPAGMGDAMVGLWIAEGARAVGEKVYFVDGSYGEIIRAFGHETKPKRSKDCMVLGSGSDSYEAEMHSSHLDNSNRPVRWQRTMGWNFTATRPTIKSLPEEALNWAKAMHDGRPLVVLAPKANFESRSMPMQKWLRLAWALEKSGVRTIAIDRNKEAVEAFPFFAYGFGWSHIIALLASAHVVAGNDSGIPHIAATLQVPTVVAIGPTNPDIVFGHCKDYLVPISASGVECFGCHFRAEKGYQVACDHGCDALQSISWREVQSKILELAGLGTRLASAS